MRQNIQVQPAFSAGFYNNPLSEYFRNSGDRLIEESALFASAVTHIMATEGHLTNKAIILWLITALETTDDVVTADVIRNTLEIVVGYTMDDI